MYETPAAHASSTRLTPSPNTSQWLWGDAGLRGIVAMDSDKISLAETDEDILTFDVPDDALERAACVGGGIALTIAYCTQDWMACGWPL
jgi:hypothetical protein